MNKQEALEAILTEARQYEESGREVRERSEAEIQSALLEAAREMDHIIARLRSGDITTRTQAQYRNRLRRLAGAALTLMVTEVKVVEGRALDEWLNEGGAEFPQSSGEEYHSERQPVNGGMVGKTPVVVHYSSAPVSPSPQLSRDAGYRYGGPEHG